MTTRTTTRHGSGHHRPRRAFTALTATALALGGLAACGGSKEDKVLRIAMGSPGEGPQTVWQAAADEFEKTHDGWTVELNFMDDDQYETVGLPSLLNGSKAPDIYFEWAGDRLANRVKDGFATDLAPFLKEQLKDIWDPAVFTATAVDGKSYLIPSTADVTTALWYNADIMSAAGVKPPTTMAELTAACETLAASGTPMITLGNKDLWPAGNFFGMIASRMVGEEAYASALSGKSSFEDPAWIAFFEQVKAIADAKCLNEGANAIADNEGAQLFFQGKAAIHPIGSWLVSWALEESPDLNFDFVNIPAIDGGKGDQTSVMGVVTGHVINAKSKHKDEAIEFMASLNSQASVDKFIEAGVIPVALASANNTNVDARIAGMNKLLANAGTIVSPPDTGYDVEIAGALYQAIGAVMGGQASPADAAKTLAAEVKQA